MKQGKVIWLTGLPCSGKTTIANELNKLMKEINHVVVLDGDEVRETISANLGFSIKDRTEHLMRIGYIAKMISRNGIDVICAFVSPIEKVRDEIRKMMGDGFIEVFVNAPVNICRKRDVKGMWAKALNGEIENFTGFSAPYESPWSSCEVICNTGTETVEQSVNKILNYLNKQRAGALYIGRFQPFHSGHKYIIRQSIEKGLPIIIAIRQMYKDDKNPFSAEEIKRDIEKVYEGKNVKVIIIPNIRSINIGRKVGYDIVKIDAPEEIEKISATEIRKNDKTRNN